MAIAVLSGLLGLPMPAAALFISFGAGNTIQDNGAGDTNNAAGIIDFSLFIAGPGYSVQGRVSRTANQFFDRINLDNFQATRGAGAAGGQLMVTYEDVFNLPSARRRP